jgi:hypothetical protein
MVVWWLFRSLKYVDFFDKVGFYVCFVCALSASEIPTFYIMPISWLLLTVDGNISIAWLFWPDFADSQPAFSGLAVIFILF